MPRGASMVVITRKSSGILPLKRSCIGGFGLVSGRDGLLMLRIFLGQYVTVCSGNSRGQHAAEAKNKLSQGRVRY